MCENTKNECLFLVPVFYFKWEGNVCPSTWEGHVCRSRVGSVFLFSFSLKCLHVFTRSLPWHTNRTHMWTHMWLKIPRMCRPHKISSIAMASMFAPAHFSCSHSTSSTLTSSSSIPSSRTTSQVTLPISKHCAAPPIVESGHLAFSTSSTGFVPIDLSETSEIFLQEQSSGTMPSYVHDAELSDETIGKALSSPPFTQEREEPGP